MTRELIVAKVLMALSFLLMVHVFAAVAYLHGFLAAICVFAASVSLSVCVIVVIKLITMNPKE